MIVKEELKDGRVRTYSDSGYMITRDGFVFEEAVDVVPHTYTETDIRIETTPAYTAEQLEGMTSAELKAICTEMGIATSMVKQNMIDLILGKQSSLTD